MTEKLLDIDYTKLDIDIMKSLTPMAREQGWNAQMGLICVDKGQRTGDLEKLVMTIDIQLSERRDK